MKYLFFTAAVLGMIPGTVFMICKRKLIRWGVLGLILPLLFFDSTALNFMSHAEYRGTSRGMEVSLIYIVAATLLLTFTILRGRRRLFPDRGSRIYLAYFILCLPSVLNAPNTQFYFFEVWKMLMIHMVFMAVYYYLEFYDGDIDIIFYGVTALVAGNFFSVLQQHFAGFYRVRGVFPHQNSMAMYMAIAGILLFARCFNNHEPRKTRIFFIGFLLASITLVRSYSRGAIFCYPIGLTLTFLCSLSNGITPHKSRLMLFLLPLIIIGTAFFAPKIVHRFVTAPKASANTRKEFALAAVNMMRDKPWIGVGMNNWGIVINPPYKYSTHRENRYDMNDDTKDGIVETIYLLVGAECGIPCLLALLVWLGYYWLSSIRLMKLLRHTEYFYLPAGFFGALTAVYMQSTLEWVLKQQINFIWLVTIFAVISFLNKHYGELYELEQRRKSGLTDSDDLEIDAAEGREK